MNKLYITLLVILFCTNINFAQSNFSNGFSDGYKKGYCQNQGIGCMSPLPPIAPIPKIGENMNSYQDGYNRGFEAGLNSQKSSNNNNSTRERFKAQSIELSKDNVYNPYENIQGTIALANALRESKGQALEYLEEEEYQKAANIAYTGLSVSPKDNEFMLILGQAFKGVNDNVNAVKWFRKTLSNGFNDNNNNLKNLIIKLENNSTEENSQKYEDNKSDQNAAVYYKKAEELWKNKDTKGALEQMNLSIDASPNYAGSYHFRGFIYLYGIRNYDKAVEDFTKAIQMQPDFIGSYFYRGMAYQDLEKNIEAIKDFTKVISMDKDNTNTYFMRALIKSNMNDRQGAISDYDEILKREKTAKPSVYKMSTVYNNKAYCLVELGKPSEALPFVTKALDLDETEGYIWDTRGEIYYKLGEYEKCIKDMNKAISIDKEADNSYYLRGLAKIKIGKSEEGCKDLSKAGELGKTEAYEAMKQNCK